MITGIGEREKILRIGIVGAPQSGKTSLVEYLRNALKEEYQVAIAEEPPTRLLKAGLNPPYNISGLDFQVEVLEEYSSVYDRIDEFMHIFEKNDKPLIILYDTLPEIGQCYLKNKDEESLNFWKEEYSVFEDYFKEHKPNKIFITELLQGEFSTKGNAVRRNIETNKILSIDEKINELYPEAELLPNDIGLEARANIVLDYIEEFFRPKTHSFTISSVTQTQTCPKCGWGDAIDYYNPYKYCPMCGTQLSSGIKDRLGEEARRKMFYVDPDSLPIYWS